jgi:hypothetical protein
LTHKNRASSHSQTYKNAPTLETPPFLRIIRRIHCYIIRDLCGSIN